MKCPFCGNTNIAKVMYGLPAFSDNLVQELKKVKKYWEVAVSQGLILHIIAMSVITSLVLLLMLLIVMVLCLLW